MLLLSDSALIEKYKAGHENAFAILLQRHKQAIYNVIKMIVKDTYLAEDLFQETFIKVVTLIKSEQYHDEGKFSSWVMRIAYNLSIDQFRKSKKNTTITDSEGNDLLQNLNFADEQEADTHLLHNEDIHTLTKLLSQLPDDQREVVTLRHYGDLSFKEIAALTQSSINTVLGRMRYALINLRKMLEKQEFNTLN